MQRSRGAPLLLRLCLLAVLVAPEAAGGDPRIVEDRTAWLDPDGVLVSDADLALIDGPASRFRNEALYITGRLDNGWVFTTGFFAWRLGIFGGFGAYALVGRPDGERSWVLRQLRREQLRIEPGHLSVQADGVRFSGSGSRYEAFFDADGLVLDLTLEALLPAWRPGDGLVRFTDDPTSYRRLSLPFPWARVQGWVTVDGQRVAVQGQAYSDLTTTELPPRRLPPVTTCVRLWSPPGGAESEAWFLSVIEYDTHPALGSERQRLLLLARGGRWVLTTPEVSLAPTDFAETPDGTYPERVALRAQDQGYLLTGEYRTSVLYETTDMFGEVPPPLRPIVGLFSQRSLNFRTIGTFKGTLVEPDGSSHPLELSGQGEYLVVR